MKSSATFRSVFMELLLISFTYVLLSPLVAMPLYNKILFFPDNRDYENETAIQFKKLAKIGCNKRDVWFTSQSGNRLHGWILLFPKSKRIVLVSHGNGGNIASRLPLATALIETGSSVFLYDYQGYGRSQGQPTVKNICADAISAFDYLVEVEKFNPQNLVAYGESIGGAVTCELSERRKPGAIILQSTFPSLVSVARDRLWFLWLYPSSWFPHLECLTTVNKEHPPLAIIHGDNDPVFSAQYAQHIYRSAVDSKELSIIKNMGHSVENAEDLAFHNAITKFIDKVPESN